MSETCPSVLAEVLEVTKLPITIGGEPINDDGPGFMLTAKCGRTSIRIAIMEASHYLPMLECEAVARFLAHAGPRIHKLESTLAAKTAECERLREALAFYADSRG